MIVNFIKPLGRPFWRSLPIAGVLLWMSSMTFASGTLDTHDVMKNIDKNTTIEQNKNLEKEESAQHGPKPLLELPEFLPNLVSFFTFHPDLHHYTIIQWLHIYAWENMIFSMLTAGFLLGAIFFILSTSKNPTSVPGRLQMLLEMIFEGLDNLVCGVIRHGGRKYTPFIGSLFLYIWCMNMQGLVPGLKAPSSYIGVTAGLGVTVFFYVQFTALKENGIGGYFHHLAGSPVDVVGWIMAPLMFVLHTVGEFIKPLSLSLRLFGNVMGEDSLIGVFGLLGIVLLSYLGGGPTTLDSMMGLPAQYELAELAVWQWFGIPLQLPFMILALLTGTIQALVFSLLSTIYIFLMLPHDDHDHEMEHQTSSDSEPLDLAPGVANASH